MAPFFRGFPPRPMGHRGAAGEAPENTIPSFRLAIEQGAQILETDVRASADGEVVVFHDPTLGRTTEGSGRVESHSLSTLRSLDAGYQFTADAGKSYPYRGRGVRIPTLWELIETFPGVQLNIEVKQDSRALVEKVVGLVRQAGRPVLLAAEDDFIMRQIRAAAPDISTSFSAAEVASFVRAVVTGDVPTVPSSARALQIPPSFGGIELVTASTVDAAHALGVEVHVWTINDPEEMERLLSLGVDGIMSDFPARVVEVMRGR